MLEGSGSLRERIMENTRYFKEGITRAGFDIVRGDTAIIPIMIYDEPLAVKMADMLLDEGIYVIGFVYPVVPKGKARIRVQISASHTKEQMDMALEAFEKVGRKLGIV